MGDPTAAGLHQGDRRTVVRHTVVDLTVAPRRHTMAAERQPMEAARMVVLRLRTVAGRQVTGAGPMADRLLPTVEADQRRPMAEVAAPAGLAAEAAEGTRHPVAGGIAAEVEDTAAAVEGEAMAAVDVTRSKQLISKSRPMRAAFLLATEKHLSRSA